MPGFSFKTSTQSSYQVARARFENAVKKVKDRQLLAVKRAALMTERELKKGIKSGAPGGQKFKPLSPITMLLRKGTKPLIDSGSLIGSITTTLDRKNNAAFVGVHRTARGSDGTSLVNVAVIHEFGTKPYVIKVTDGVRRLFFWLHRASNGAINPISPNKTEILHPGVPARPFVRPTIEKIRPKLQAVLAKAFTEHGGPI